ncbi:MAG: hypothetical protein V1765_01215, partial [bacterium]
RIIHVSGNVYAIVYRHVLSGGAIRTVTIDNNGNIGSVIDTYVYSILGNYDPAIIKVGSQMYAIAHHDSISGGEMFTISIQDDGTIVENIVDTFVFDNSQGEEPNWLQIAEDIFAISYRGSGDDGFTKTVTINDSGQIADSIIDSLEFNITNGYNPHLTYLLDDIYGMVYHDNTDYGSVSIFYINPTTGVIDDTVLDSFSFDINAGGGSLSMTNVIGLVYAIAYDGPNNDGFVTTIELDAIGTYPSDGPDIYPNTAYAPPHVDKWVKIEETANKNGGEIYYQISDDNGLNWYYWDGADWSTATEAGNYNTAVEINEQLWSWPATTESFNFRAFLVSDGTQNVQLDALTINCSNFQMEVKQTTVDEGWKRVPFANIYSNPVIVTGYLEGNNWRPASIRIKNVTSSFFDLALQEPSNNNLTTETVYYMVVEEGVWEINGQTMEAHNYTTSRTGSTSNWLYDTTVFNYDFDQEPIVLHQVMSTNDTNWISTYASHADSATNPPGLGSFRLALNGAEAFASHGSETIGWIAMEKDVVGNFEGTSFETKRTADSVYGHDDGCYATNFANTYDVNPLVVSAQQEMDDNDGSWSVICSLATGNVGLHSEEDRVVDSERNHGSETHGFMAWSRSFSFSSVGDAQAFQNYGSLVSSALDMSAGAQAIQSVRWTEIVPVECPLCDVTVQLRSADTQGGLTTAEWSGPAGATDSFINPYGSLANTVYNTDRWVQYRVTLQGDGEYTPTVRDITVNYK